MHISTTLQQEEIPALIDEFIGIAGLKAWSKRLSWLNQEIRANEHMKDWLLERCGVEWAPHQAIDGGELRNAQFYRLNLPGRYELVSFAAGVTAIYRQLSIAGRTRLRGQMIDGLKTDKGLLSLRHEIATAVHFAAAGFDVQCHDLESGGGFDFLVVNQGLEAEVECKLFSGDVGRRIHKRAQVNLFRRMRDSLMRVVDGLRCGLVVRVTFRVRLSNSESQHSGVCRAVESALVSGGPYSFEDCTVTLLDFQASAGPLERFAQGELDKVQFRKFIGGLTGNWNPNVVLLTSKTGQPLVVIFESMKSDDVLGGIRRQLRDAAADQFTRSRPGILAAQLTDLTDSQLLDLARLDTADRGKATGLQIMTSDLLQAESRSHVHSIVYRGTPSVWSDNGTCGGGGAAYVMRNEFHPLAHDERLAAVGSGTASRPRVVQA